MMLDRSYAPGFDRTSWDALRIYGSLSKEQRNALESATKFPISGLNPTQKALINRVIYNDEIRSETFVPTGYSTNRTMIEPTDEFVDGLPITAALSASAKSVPTIAVYSKTADGKIIPVRTMDAMTLAHYEADPVFNKQAGIKNLAGYSIANNKMITLKIELSPTLFKPLLVSLTEYPDSPTPVASDALPEPYKTEIANAIKQVKARQITTRSVPPPR